MDAPNDVTVVETTSGQSQKLFKTSETVNLTEKIQGTQQGHKMSHNVGTRFFSGFLVRFASGVVEWNCWMKQQSNTETGGTYSYPNWLFGCSALVTEPNRTQQVGYVGIQYRILFGMIKNYDIYKKIK